MAKFWLSAAVGLYLLQLCLAQISLNISCRYAGVFHVEKNRRYSLTKEEAIELCKALNSTLPTWEQMEKAFSLGLETCRYGYIEEKIVVPRHTPYHLCAANTTGIYVLQSNISDRYDTYCFNSSEERDKVCDPVTELYSSWPDDQSIIEISNADGTRYIGGSLYTELPPVTDDDSSMGSGSANDRGTTDPNVITSGIFHTSFNEGATQFPYGVHPTDESHLQSPDDPEDHNVNHDNEDQNPNKDLDSYEKQKDSSEELEEPGNEGDKYDGGEQLYPGSPGSTVVSSSDVKHEDSTRDSLIHVVHSGWDNEVRYSANDTRDGTLPGTVPPGDGEHYSTGKILELIKNIIVTAVSSSGNFLTQKVSTLHSQDGVHSGLEAEASFPTNTTSDDSHLGLVPSDEKQNDLEEDFHAAVFVNGSAKDEESHQDQLLSVDKPGGRRGGSSSTNRTSHDVVQILIPPSESDRENKSAQTDSNQDQLPLGSDGRSSQNEHEQESSDTDEVSNDVMKHEESTQNPPAHEMHPDSEWDSEEQYSTNTSSEETLPEIIPPSENEHKNTSVYTVADSIDETKHEDVTNRPAVHDMQHEQSRENEYPTNSTNEEGLAFFPPPENSNEGFHTAVIHNNDAHHEDSTQEPLPPVHQPDWHTEEEYSTNISRDDILMGVIANNGSEHDPLHTDVVSHDGTKDEDSTLAPVKYDSEDKYSTSSAEGVLLPGIVPRRGTNHKNNTYHTGLVPNQPEDRGSQQGDSTPETQPRAAHIPDWLIVVASLLALALILGVCIAVNSRRRCGQKQKLVINNGKGVVDNKNMGGLNGEASKSHEMVHLVHKEQPEDQTGSHDEFLQIDETNNLQEVDLKSGV
ncbi:PREDICTED: CD44 antigen isoform X2 [Gekko japonicus]|uniref:CD44 antigen n=1 Tax=Gekko japonicus TaxID=146911 RepID=A0ABM1JWE7_GEKJA|nr:PREDICTED: CD44 antigen isoform X2 [Gekko japonicus]